ncbi:hypothetical protein GCM10009619_22490 [Williamsia maris]
MGAAAISAMTIPTTNHGRWPGSQFFGATPAASGRASAIQPHDRLIVAAARSSGIRRRARSPRNRTTANAISGSSA